MPRGRDSYGHAELQKRLWTPDLLGSSLVAWYSADYGVTVVSDKVSNWVDKSGRGYTASQSNSAIRPIYTGRSITLTRSNTPILTTVLETEDLRIPTLITKLTNYTGRFAVSALCRIDADPTSTDARIFNIEGTTGAARFAIFTKLTTLGFRVGGRRLTADSLVSIAHSSVETGKWFVVTGIADFINGVFYLRVNGIQSSVAMPSGGGYTSDISSTHDPIILRLGKNSLVEAVIYENFYNDTLIEGYLAWRHGIAFSNEHPFVSRPPLIGD